MIYICIPFFMCYRIFLKSDRLPIKSTPKNILFLPLFLGVYLKLDRLPIKKGDDFYDLI